VFVRERYCILFILDFVYVLLLADISEGKRENIHGYAKRYWESKLTFLVIFS
jgi:hypothetical protein